MKGRNLLDNSTLREKILFAAAEEILYLTTQKRSQRLFEQSISMAVLEQREP